MKSDESLSVVVSVFNEEKVLNIFWAETEKHLVQLGINYEVIFVNDGSTDRSKDILAEFSKADEKVKVINLSRNYGHEAAMIAGIDHSSGSAVVCMDADLQHPPGKLGEMLEKYLEGYEIITMNREKNEDAGLLKSITSALFYYLLNLLSLIKFEPNASDFFLISRRVTEIIKRDFDERTRFLRGFIQIVGFRRTTLSYISAQRAAGSTKYSIPRLFTLSIGAIAAFSNIPLRLGLFIGVMVGVISILVGFFSIAMKLFGYVIPGYTTIVVLITFLLAVQFFILGIIGEYLGFIFNEIKKRPIYIIENSINIREGEM